MNRNSEDRKQSLALYRIDDKVFFKPNAYVKGIQVMMEYTNVKLFDEDPEELGRTLLKSLNECVTLSQMPKENYFKNFLKISKTKSNIGLVRKAKFALVSKVGGLLTIHRVEANLKYKDFMVESRIPKQEYNLEENNFRDLGVKMKIALA